MWYIVPVLVVYSAVTSSSPTLTRVIPFQGGCIASAVTSLGDDVFVVRCNSQQVKVNDAVTLTSQRHITVHGLRCCPCDLIACSDKNFLYMSDTSGLIVLLVTCDDTLDVCLCRKRPTAGTVRATHDVRTVPVRCPYDCTCRTGTVRRPCVHRAVPVQ